jgi:uncharacterized membrane protein
MENSITFKIGSTIYALVIAFFGVNHFLVGTGMQNTVPSFIPGGVAWVYITGAALIAAAIAFITGWQRPMAGYLLAAFLIIIVFTIHIPAIVNAPDMHARRFPLTNLVKDMGLAGAALMVAARR